MSSWVSADDLRRLAAMAAVSCSLAAFAAEKLPTGYGNPAKDIASGSVAGLTWQGAARAYKIGDEVVLVFTNTAENACSFSLTDGAYAVGRYLVVGGGGPGGDDAAEGLVGGGGGAGGMIEALGVGFICGDYSVTVGAGGRPNGSNTNQRPNDNGGDSILCNGAIELARAFGGGGGGIPNGSWNETTPCGRPGGSGGGGAMVCCYSRDGGAGAEGQGYAGGASATKEGHYNNGGGGGGAGEAGANAEADRSGDGGRGAKSDITGADVWYAGGGAGGAWREAEWNSDKFVNGGTGGGGSAAAIQNSTTSESGTDGLGGGGAGASVNASGVAGCAAGRGGNGVVVVRLKVKVEPFLGDITCTGAARAYNVGFGKRRQTIFVFTNVNEVGTLTIGRRATARVLLVGGGGPGGLADGPDIIAGGGGAGGMVTNDYEGVQFAKGTYSVTVGAGGLPVDSRKKVNNKGGDSVLALKGVDVYRAFGGGGGGMVTGDNDTDVYTKGVPGGSGGGASTGVWLGWYRTAEGGSGVEGQGHAGGASAYCEYCYQNGGGGGGAGAPGGDSASSNQSGAGGDGLPCDITGIEIWYAGGGAGGEINSKKTVLGGKGGGGSSHCGAYEEGETVLSLDGVDGLGGGGAGGGGKKPDGSVNAGGRGGNGVVIVRITSVAPDGMAVFVK